jgi:hypothetical protein
MWIMFGDFFLQGINEISSVKTFLMVYGIWRFKVKMTVKFIRKRIPLNRLKAVAFRERMTWNVDFQLA